MAIHGRLAGDAQRPSSTTTDSSPIGEQNQQIAQANGAIIV